jgi:hypothetical protein
MKMFFRSLIALAYLASATLAQAGFVINPFVFAASTPASISFVGCTGEPSGTGPFTFTNHATGTAGARKTIVGVVGQDGTTDFSISGVTVGGNAATEAVDSADAGSLVQAAIYIIDNPTGTTATIVATFSEAINNAAICVWAAYDVVSETKADFASNFQTAAAALTLDLDIPADGIAVGMSYTDANLQTVTWTGMTERSETIVSDGGSTSVFSGADSSTPGTPTSVSADWTGTDDSIGVSASFR